MPAGASQGLNWERTVREKKLVSMTQEKTSAITHGKEGRKRENWGDLNKKTIRGEIMREKKKREDNQKGLEGGRA